MAEVGMTTTPALVTEHVGGSTLRVYADGPGLFRWTAVQYRPIALFEIYAAGIGRLEGHETSQEAALQAARRYEPLLGIGADNGDSRILRWDRVI